jgi:predicted outer membrane lipoprotein
MADYTSAVPIEHFSDGVKAYTGTIIEVVAGDPRIILIDEPEAFLHPPLAQQLGVELSEVVLQSRKNVFVATHSAHFVMGCLQSGAPVDVIRLTYKDGVATARVLKNDELTLMMRNPLLRSTGVINALFYEHVVVTESDSDRAFYQEINDRLLKYAPGRGIPNCLFLNAQNKQTTRQIAKPLRELGIPTIGLVDVDILKEGGKVWSGFLESGGLPELDRNALATSREMLYSKAKHLGLDIKKGGGISQFQKADREAADNLFERLEQYGLFVVRGGELESWLKHLGVCGHSPEWLVNMFEKLGDDPSKPEFVRPGDTDVWEFVDRMRSWFLNPARKGMPD